MDNSDSFTSVRVSLRSGIHLAKGKSLRGEFSANDRIQDVMNFYLNSDPKLKESKENFVLLNHKRELLQPDLPLGEASSNDLQPLKLILSIRQRDPSKKLDLLLILALCFCFGVACLCTGLLMYVTHGWSSLDGRLSVINAYSQGTELSLFDRKGRSPFYRCFINSTTGITSLANRDGTPENGTLGYLTASHCFNKTVSSSVFLGATQGISELNRTDPCLARELFRVLYKTLRSLAPDGKVEMISSVDEGALSWRSLNMNGSNKTVSDWGAVSLQIVHSTMDPGRANRNITLRNGKRVFIISKDYECYGETTSYYRYLVTLLYDKYKDLGRMPLEIEDPCLSANGTTNYTLSHLFQQSCTRHLRDVKFSKEVFASLSHRVHYIPVHKDLRTCSNRVQETLQNCQNTFQEFCSSETDELSTETVHALGRGFYLLRKELLLSTSPTETEWKQALTTACDYQKPSGQLCFSGVFIHLVFKSNQIVFEDNWVEWPMGYADEFYSREAPRDPFTTISSPAFTLVTVLSVSFISVGSFFAFQYFKYD